MVKLSSSPVVRISNWLQRNIVERLLLRRSYERIYLLMAGHIFFQTLRAAVEFDLFSLLRERKRLTRAEISAALGCAEKPIRILLLGCVTLGLLRKRGPFYSNTLIASQLFTRSARGNVIDIVRWQHHINYRPLFHFKEAIEANSNIGLQEFPGAEPALYARLAHDPRLERIFQDAMQSISVQANTMLGRSLDLSKTGYLVDVGGGNGTNIIALARLFPQLRAAVFDAASVCEIALQNIASQGFSDRLGAHAGDCFVDPLPRGVDTVLLAHFCTIWSEERNQQLLRKCFEELPSGGAVIIFNMMQHNSEDGPFGAAMGSPYFLTLATGEGMLYTWDEYEKWLRAAGFRSIQRRALPRNHGVIIGTKA